MRRKKVISFIVITLIGFGVFIGNMMFNVKKQTQVIQGEEFPKIQFYTKDDEKVKEIFLDGNNVIFYLSDTCSACVQKLESISMIIDIYSLNGWSYLILWEDNIPLKKIEKFGIDTEINYTLKGKFEIGKVPQYFILDQETKVKFRIESNLDILVRKIREEMLGVDVKYQEKAIKYILNKEMIDLKTEDEVLILFETTNGEECYKLKKIINKSEIEDKYKVVWIDDDYWSSSDNINDSTGILRNIFNINSYPAGVLIKNTQIMKNFKNSEEIQKYLKKMESKIVK